MIEKGDRMRRRSSLCKRDTQVPTSEESVKAEAHAPMSRGSVEAVTASPALVLDSLVSIPAPRVESTPSERLLPAMSREFIIMPQMSYRPLLKSAGSATVVEHTIANWIPSRAPLPRAPKAAVQLYTGTALSSASRSPRDENARSTSAVSGVEREQCVSHLAFVAASCARSGASKGEVERKEEAEDDNDNEETTWRAAFERFKFDGNIHRDELPEVLKFCGFTEPRAAWVSAAADKVTEDRSLDRKEFLIFMDDYCNRNKEEVADVFARADADGNGVLSLVELMPLFGGYGLTPLRHVIQEIISEVDKDGDGEVNVQELFRCLEIVRCRFGFPKSVIDKLRQAFNKFDGDGSGSMDTVELTRVLHYLHIPMTEDEIREIGAAVDTDKSGTLSSTVFLMCMSRVRELELTRIRQLIAAHDVDGSGGTSYVELSSVLQELGYKPEFASLRDAVEDLGLNFSQDFDLSDVSRILDMFREREGLPRAEYMEVVAAFKEFDQQGTGSISNEDCLSVLRRLGYMIASEKCMQLVKEVDVDESGCLDHVELGKLLRLYREQDIDKITDAFVVFDEDTDGELSSEEAYNALCSLFGSMVDNLSQGEHSLSKSSKKSFDRFEFISLAVDQWRKERLVYTKSHAGYTMDEMALLKKKFCKYETDVSARLSNEKMRMLFADLMTGSEIITGGFYTLKVSRPVVQQVIKEANVSQNLNFNDYVQVMRLLENLSERERLEREREIVSQLNFNMRDVEVFRECFFGERTDPRLRVEFGHLTEMLDGIVPLGDKNLNRLASIFQEVVPASFDGARSADFPAFLQLMHTLVQENFGQLKDKAAVAVAFHHGHRLSIMQQRLAVTFHRVTDTSSAKPKSKMFLKTATAEPVEESGLDDWDT